MTMVNIFDMVSTYYVSPTLEYESNIWVKFFSLNFLGLILVAIFFQLLNTFPLWYYCFKFKSADYAIRRNNSINEVARIYLFNGGIFQTTRSLINRIISVITSFLGYYLPIEYIINKTIVSASNFTVGYFFRNVTINKKVGIDVDITYDKENQFWQTLYGKFMLFYMQCTPSQKLILQNVTTSAFVTLFCIFYFICEYKKAISTPINRSFVQLINVNDNKTVLRSCYFWITVYVLFLVLENSL